MESELYKSIFSKGEARGEARNQAATIIRILNRRLGTVEPAICGRVLQLSDRDMLEAWYDAALDVVDAQGALQLVETIRKAPLP